MPAAKHLPRTRALRAIPRLATMFSTVGLVGTILCVVDLVNGKDAVTGTVVAVVVLAVGVALLVVHSRASASAAARDWQNLPPTIRRDLPYGAQETSAGVVLPVKASWVVVMWLFAAVCLALAVLAVVDIDQAIGAVITAVPFVVIGGFFAGMALWLRYRVRWTIDSTGIRNGNRPHKAVWGRIGSFGTGSRGHYVAVFGPDRRRLMAVNLILLEVAADDLVAMLHRGAAVTEPPVPDTTVR